MLHIYINNYNYTYNYKRRSPRASSGTESRLASGGIACLTLLV